MPREPIPVRVAAFNPGRCRPGSYGVLVAVSSGYPPDRGRLLTCYAPLRRSPPCSIATPRAAPRLACVKPAASVHPEPGSNSSLYINALVNLFPVLGTLLFLYFLSLVNDLFRLPGNPVRRSPSSPFPKGTAKIRTFSLPPNFFQTFFKSFFSGSALRAPQDPVIPTVTAIKNFCGIFPLSQLRTADCPDTVNPSLDRPVREKCADEMPPKAQDRDCLRTCREKIRDGRREFDCAI